MTHKRVGPVLVATSPAPKQLSRTDSTAFNRYCAVCRRPTVASRFCGPCRVWSAYLERIGSLAEVAR